MIAMNVKTGQFAGLLLSGLVNRQDNAALAVNVLIKVECELVLLCTTRRPAVFLTTLFLYSYLYLSSTVLLSEGKQKQTS